MSQARALLHITQARAMWHTAAILDPLVLTVARGLSRFTRITGAGVFYWQHLPSFWDAWTEQSTLGGGSLTVRMGRLELIVDWRA